MLRELNTNEFKYAKTYATEKALRKRIAEDASLYPGFDDEFVVIRTPEGRWTALVILCQPQYGRGGRYAFINVQNAQ